MISTYLLQRDNRGIVDESFLYCQRSCVFESRHHTFLKFYVLIYLLIQMVEYN